MSPLPLSMQPSKRAAPKPAVKMSPAEVMHNRLMEMQRRALEAAEARKAVADAQAAVCRGINASVVHNNHIDSIDATQT